MLIPIQQRAPIYFFPKNTSKKVIEVKIQKDRALRIKLVSLASILPGFILWYLTRTQMRDLYQIVDKQLPISVELSPIITIILAGMMYYILCRITTAPQRYTTFPTNDGRLGVSVIPDTKQDLKIVLTVFAFMGVILALFIVPIFQIVD